MVNEYKKIILLKGLEVINEYHFKIIKSLLAHDLQLTRQMQDECNRIEIADLMEEKFRGAACVDILINVFKDMPQLTDLAKILQNEKSKVARKIRVQTKTPVKKKNQEDMDCDPSVPTVSRALPYEKVKRTPWGQEKKPKNRESAELKRVKLSQEKNQHSKILETSTSQIESGPQAHQSFTLSPTSTFLTKEKKTKTRETAELKKMKLSQEKSQHSKILETSTSQTESVPQAHQSFISSPTSTSLTKEKKTKNRETAALKRVKLSQEKNQHSKILETSTSQIESGPRAHQSFTSSPTSTSLTKKRDTIDSSLKEEKERISVCPPSPHIQSQQTFVHTYDLQKTKVPQEQGECGPNFGCRRTSPTEIQPQTPVMTEVFSSFTCKKRERSNSMFKEAKDKNEVYPTSPPIQVQNTVTQTCVPKRMSVPQEQPQQAHVFGSRSIVPTGSQTLISVNSPVSPSTDFTSKKRERSISMLKEEKDKTAVWPTSAGGEVLPQVQHTAQTSVPKRKNHSQDQFTPAFGNRNTYPPENQTHVLVMVPIFPSFSLQYKKKEISDTVVKKEKEEKAICPTPPPIPVQHTATHTPVAQRMNPLQEQHQPAHISGSRSIDSSDNQSNLPVTPSVSPSTIFPSKKKETSDIVVKKEKEEKAICPTSPPILVQHTATHTPVAQRMNLLQEQHQPAHVSGSRSTDSMGKHIHVPVTPSVSPSSRFISKKKETSGIVLKEEKEENAINPTSPPIPVQHTATHRPVAQRMNLFQEQHQPAHVSGSRSTYSAGNQSHVLLMPSVSPCTSFPSKEKEISDIVVEKEKEEKAICPASPTIPVQHTATHTSVAQRMKLLQEQHQPTRVSGRRTIYTPGNLIYVPVMPSVSPAASFPSKKKEISEIVLKVEKEEKAIICTSPPIPVQHTATHTPVAQRMNLLQEQHQPAHISGSRSTDSSESQSHVPVTSSVSPSTSFPCKKRKDTSTNTDDSKRMKVTLEQSQSRQTSTTSTSPTESHPEPHVMSPLIQSSSSLNKKRELKTKFKEVSREEGIQKGPKRVMVLNATVPFVYEHREENRKMFHATVATQSEFFHVKVFDISLKEKFTPKKVIAISDYVGRNGFLEVYNVSNVSDVDQKMEVSSTLIKTANATPKICHLFLQVPGTFVNGVFQVCKKMVRDKCIYYEIQDNTGKMEVMVYGRLTQNDCQEGDKLQLICFELSLSMNMWQLRSVTHSFMKVIKTKKHTKQPINPNSDVETLLDSPS